MFTTIAMLPLFLAGIGIILGIIYLVVLFVFGFIKMVFIDNASFWAKVALVVFIGWLAFEAANVEAIRHLF